MAGTNLDKPGHDGKGAAAQPQDANQQLTL